eukprot:9482667-Pyramimonas_sp.AAC.1
MIYPRDLPQSVRIFVFHRKRASLASLRGPFLELTSCCCQVSAGPFFSGSSRGGPWRRPSIWGILGPIQALRG